MTQIQREDLFRAGAEAHKSRDYGKAGQLYSQFVKLNPGVPEAWEKLGILFGDIGNFAEAENCLRSVLRFLPEWSERHRLHAHLCWIYSAQGHADAVSQGREAVRLAPEYEVGWLHLGAALVLAGRNEEAIQAFERARALGSQRYHAGLLVAKRHACDWDGMEELERIVLDPGYQDKEFTPSLLAAASSAQAQLALAKTFAKRYPPRYIHQPGVGRKVANRKIRLGYLSGEFHDTSTMSLLAQTIENFDRDRFELHAFSFGPNREGPMRQRLRSAFGHFHELSTVADEVIARGISTLNIDILVDLNGYLTANRVGIVARRPAPIQISHLGWPATMGAPFIDYILADRIVAADQASFTEMILHLDCYMPTDNSKAEPRQRKRSEFGLPEDTIVLSSMNNSWKLTSAMFELWCDILREIPQAVLLQAVPDDDTARRLSAFMGHQGLGDRLIIAPKINYGEHIDRVATLDLGLDSFPYGGHTTTCDTLWAGTPVVTCHGGNFASGVATSLLNAVDLSELSVSNLAHYKDLVIALCRDRPRLAGLKAKLNATRRTSRLFDNERYTRGLEAKLIELVS